MINIAKPQMGLEEKQSVLEVVALPVRPALSEDDRRTVIKAADSCSGAA